MVHHESAAIQVVDARHFVWFVDEELLDDRVPAGTDRIAHEWFVVVRFELHTEADATDEVPVPGKRFESLKIRFTVHSIRRTGGMFVRRAASGDPEHREDQ